MCTNREYSHLFAP